MVKKIIDTNILIENPDIILDKNCVIPSVVFSELEGIKTSGFKNEEVKYKARKAIRLLNENSGKFSICVVDNDIYKIVEQHNLPITNDNLIIACAYKLKQAGDDVVFLSNDGCARFVAEGYFCLDVENHIVDKQNDEYKGYKEVCLDDNELAHFYENLNQNTYACHVNQYLVLKNDSGSVLDTLKWNGSLHVNLSPRNFKSRMFGNIKPLDYIQRCAFDSIQTNDITVLHGRAGSGKTTLPLSYIMQGIETQKFAKCHIIYHYEPLKGARTLGFEKGDHITKLFNTAALGNILSAKFGDDQTILNMISAGTINVIPTANIRGVEFGSDDVVFCTESQNLNPYTLKTIIQRCKDGCKQIYEGDILEQSDINCGQLGISRMIEIFKGYEKFGCVKLKNNYRSEICELADKM